MGDKLCKAAELRNFAGTAGARLAASGVLECSTASGVAAKHQIRISKSETISKSEIQNRQAQRALPRFGIS
jgi:hypothetical protein